MGTSGGEPRTLLNALRPMLGSLGDIKTPQEVVRVISLMRDSEKLMSRCIYLNILKATISAAKENEKSSETLEKFMSIGGWSILNKWLVEAKKMENFPVLVELLEVLKDLPVDIDTLKQGNTGKIIKHLTKLDNQDVRRLAAVIVKQWMNLVRNQTGTSDKLEKPKQDGTMDADESLQAIKQVTLLATEGKPAKRLRDNSSTDSNRSPQPEKKTKTLSEVKSDVKHNMAQKNLPKIKMIPPQPKPIAVESAGFMNALTSAASAAPVRKRKRTSTTAKTATTNTTTTTCTTATTKPTFTGILDAILDSQSQTHGQEDGREKDKESKDTENSNSTNQSSSTPNGSPDNTAEAPSGDIGDFTKPSEAASEKDNSPTTASQTSSDAMSEAAGTADDTPIEERPTKKSKKGKKVQWPADDANLATFHFFEMDEEERALVRHPVNFLDAAHNEMVRERQLVEQAKRLSEDIMTERLKWYRPVAYKLDNPTPERGVKSEQKHVQKTREASILADIFLTKSSLPDSPAEPDLENQKANSEEPKVIPHDEKGTTHVPVKTHGVPSNGGGVQLPPALMSLLSSAVPGPAPERAPLTVQSLLDKLMKPSQQSNPSSLLTNPQPPNSNEPGGSARSSARQQILEPLQQNTVGPPRAAGPGMGPGAGLLGAAPGDPGGTLNVFRPPGPMGPMGPHGPQGPQGPHLRPDQPLHFQGPGGPRHGPPMGPMFAGPEGPMLGPRMRGPMPLRMQGVPGVGRGMMAGPRPLLPEMAQRDDFPPDQFDDGGEYGDEDEQGDRGDNIPPNMRGRGRGLPRGRARGRGRGRGAPPICRHFVSKRGCLRGNTCHFLHPGVNGPPV